MFKYTPIEKDANNTDKTPIIAFGKPNNITATVNIIELINRIQIQIGNSGK